MISENWGDIPAQFHRGLIRIHRSPRIDRRAVDLTHAYTFLISFFTLNFHSMLFMTIIIYFFDSYFIPEDGDLELQPNVFLAPKPRQPNTPPTLEEIKRAFPLSGRYHFRFKAPLVPGSDRDRHAMAVWMDCVDDRQCVPTWKSGIMAKVTRIGIDDDDEDDDDFVRSAPSAASAVSTVAPVASSSFDLFSEDPVPHPAAPVSAASSAPTSAAPPNFLDGHSPLGTTHKESSLLDMHHPPYNQQHPHQPPAHADFFGMSATPAAAAASPPVSGNHGYHSQQQQQQAHHHPQQHLNNHLYGQQQHQAQSQQQQPSFGGPGMYGQQQQQPQAQASRPGAPRVPGQPAAKNAFDSFSKAKSPGAFGDINDFTM
jgi:hypothetical protein